MKNNFYDKVAKKFGGYHTDARYPKEYPNGDPEKVFKEKLLELSGKNKVVLDVGCADGRFTLSIASNFNKVVAIDLSKGMLDSAEKYQKEKKIINVSFEEQDASKVAYPNNYFDVICSLRGPTPFSKFYRLLKPNGYFIGINIGEKDAIDLKKVFKRGQNYEVWNKTSRLKKDKLKLIQERFEIITAKDFIYDEYYQTYEDIDLFLQGVPIFEDYNPIKDKKYLDEYVNKFKSDKGIKLLRHRVVILARKL